MNSQNCPLSRTLLPLLPRVQRTVRTYYVFKRGANVFTSVSKKVNKPSYEIGMGANSSAAAPQFSSPCSQRYALCTQKRKENEACKWELQSNKPRYARPPPAQICKSTHTLPRHQIFAKEGGETASGGSPFILFRQEPSQGFVHG